MATIAKMYCSRVVNNGGDAYLSPCLAKPLLDRWPPPDDHIQPSAFWGHDPKHCPDCQALDLHFADGRNPTLAGAVRIPGKGSEQITLTAVKSGNLDDPNNMWAVATPSGTLEMTIDNPHAWGQFQAGQEYMVKITKAIPTNARS